MDAAFPGRAGLIQGIFQGKISHKGDKASLDRCGTAQLVFSDIP